MAQAETATGTQPSSFAWLLKLLQAPWSFIEEFGVAINLLLQSIRWGIRRPYRFALWIDAMEFIGVQSIFIVALTGTFVGMVFGIQLVDGFRKFGAENQTGAVIGLALARELAPVFCALMVSSRAGSAICTEIGSMRISNQIDALVSMAINPLQYLVVPRLIAGIIMVPALGILFNLVGVFGAWIVCVQLMGLDPGVFFDKIRWYVDTSDVVQGLVKAAFFGLAITLIACRHGYYAAGGAAGVGQATNHTVVHSSVVILFLDYMITTVIVELNLA